jgi:hypothetical protein
VGLLRPLPALAAAALLAPAAAPAQAQAQATFGLRLAWAPAVGSAADHVPMSEAVESELPIQGDALWRAGPLAFGAYGSWAFGQVGGTACADGASCSASGVRAGAEATWTFAPWSFGAAPWVGAGLGWEWATQRRERLGASTTTSWNGPELALQGGAEWRVQGPFAVGPFALVGLGSYRTVSVDTGQASASAPIANRAVHAWIHLGVRGTFDL